MWPQDFESRLRDWNDLRDRCQAESNTKKILLDINDWWFRVPTVNHHLHWHYHREWPDAWQLLHDDIYCELARALGMLYTLHMLELSDIKDISLAQTEIGNLVLIDHGKYIMNWAPGEMLNITSQQFVISRQLSSKELQHLMG